MMKDHKLSKTLPGVTMPHLIYGTAWKKERTADLVVKAALAGFRGIDTACQPKHYNEPLVGEALHRLKGHGIKREDLFLQTKFTPFEGHDPKQVPYDKNAPLEQQIAQSFEISKKNLQTHYVDSLVLHSPITPHEDLMRAWTAMEAIQGAGGALQLGISNCHSTDVMMRLYVDAIIKPTVVQNRFYQDSGYDIDLRNWCLEHGVTYQSFWTLTANPHILESHVVGALTKKYGKTNTQVFFRYLTQVGIAVLTGTCSEEHMREDLGALDFELSVDDLDVMNQLINEI